MFRNLEIDGEYCSHDPSEEQGIEQNSDVEAVSETIRPGDNRCRDSEDWDEHVEEDKLESNGSRN